MGDDELSTPMNNSGVPLERPPHVETQIEREARQQMREQIDNPMSMSGKRYSRNEKHGRHFEVSPYQWDEERVGSDLTKRTISIANKQGNERQGSRMRYQEELGRAARPGRDCGASQIKEWSG